MQTKSLQVSFVEIVDTFAKCLLAHRRQHSLSWILEFSAEIPYLMGKDSTRSGLMKRMGPILPVWPTNRQHPNQAKATSDHIFKHNTKHLSLPADSWRVVLRACFAITLAEPDTPCHSDCHHLVAPNGGGYADFTSGRLDSQKDRRCTKPDCITSAWQHHGGTWLESFNRHPSWSVKLCFV